MRVSWNTTLGRKAHHMTHGRKTVVYRSGVLLVWFCFIIDLRTGSKSGGDRSAKKMVAFFYFHWASVMGEECCYDMVVMIDGIMKC